MKDKGVFTGLGKNRPAFVRSKRFENEIYLIAEEFGIKPDKINIFYEGSQINVAFDLEDVPEAFYDRVVSDLSDFEMGVLFPPDEEEASDIMEIYNEELEGGSGHGVD